MKMKTTTTFKKEDVLEYQRNLNDDESRRISTMKRELRRKEDIYHIKHLFPFATSILCIGSRDDSEVKTFIDAGYKAHGIDICTQTDLITKLDVSELSPAFVGQYDVAYCSHVLEHISDPMKAMIAIRHTVTYGVFVILPIVDRPPDIEHPTVYEIMKYNPDTNFKNYPKAWDDFSMWKPYLVLYNCYRNALTEDYEIAFMLRFLRGEACGNG